MIERLKELSYIDENYELDNDSSSEYESDEDQEGGSKKAVKVCDNCFLFYLNVLKAFDLDSFGNLVEKKNPGDFKTMSAKHKQLLAMNSSSKKFNPDGFDSPEKISGNESNVSSPIKNMERGNLKTIVEDPKRKAFNNRSFSESRL